MTTLADHLPAHQFWLHGQRPDQPVRFDERLGLWNVHGHAEALAILSDPVTFGSDLSRLFPGIDASMTAGNLLQSDGAAHRNLRALVSHAFTPKIVADLAPRIAGLTDDLLDAVADAERIELVADLAYPLPVIVIAELLGVPASDRDVFRGWVDAMLSDGTELSLNDPDELERATAEQTEALRPLYDYLGSHAAERRRTPRADLLTELVTAEVDGQRLSDVEIVNFSALLLAAGHLTTTMLLGNTVLCLDAHPEQALRVRADPTLVPGAIEESLRMLSPFAAVVRATAAATEVGGVPVPADQMLMVSVGTANRDPRRFVDPDAFDPTRTPNPHLGFGRGVHFCLGAPLARLEGRIALTALLERFPVLRTDPDRPPTFMADPNITGVRTLPLLTSG